MSSWAMFVDRQLDVLCANLARLLANSPTMELCNGCSQKVQSFKRWQKALALCIVGS